ncbi:MAG: metallophosphoesterase [Planctomycetaceae bacterium]
MNHVIGIGILGLAVVGNATWWIIMVNRQHSRALPEWRLTAYRALHDAGVVLFPILILWKSGFGKTGLLTGGTFDQQPDWIRALLVLTMAGTIPFVLGILRWQLRRSPSALVRQESRFIDVCRDAATDASRSEICGNRSRFLVAVPGNEICRLEVNEKHIDLAVATPRPLVRNRESGRSGTSAAESMSSLNIAHFSDMHLIGCPGRGYFDFVAERLCEMRPDVFLFSGDLLDDMATMSWATDFFAKLSAVAPGFFVLGNHDWRQDHEAIRAAISQTGWVSLAGRLEHCLLGGTSVLLAGTERPWMGSSPVVPSRSNESLRILVSHSPDERDFAIQNDFDLMLAGHNHGGQIKLPVVGPVYSPSRHGVRYSCGIFEHRGMIFHVSRGVGSKDPVRWNCHPEITLLRVTGFGPSHRARTTDRNSRMQTTKVK